MHPTFEDDDENFETKIIDGKPVRILKDCGRMQTRMMLMDGAEEVLRNTALDARREASKQRGSKQHSLADARRLGLADGRDCIDPATATTFPTRHATPNGKLTRITNGSFRWLICSRNRTSTPALALAAPARRVVVKAVAVWCRGNGARWWTTVAAN
jgi:hypothetical protein